MVAARAKACLEIGFVSPEPKRSVTADTDLRLARYLGISEGVFLGLQNDYDLMERRRQIEAELQSINPRAA